MLFLMFTELQARYFFWVEKKNNNENERRINGGAEVGTNIVVAMDFFIYMRRERAGELN